MSKPHMQKEWIPQEGMIPCLSLSQPFASGIALKKKSIELRTWQTHYTVECGQSGLIALHAGKTWYGGVKFDGKTNNSPLAIKAIANAAKRMGTPAKVSDYPTGAIIAVARLVACRRLTSDEYEDLQNEHMSDAAWEANEYAWFFEDVQRLDTPIEVRGYLGLFPVSMNVLNIKTY